jgi:hypothetical protein
MHAQEGWVKKTFGNFELSFPGEPQEMDHGTTSNWFVFKDSALFQLSRINVEERYKSNFASCNAALNGIVDEAKGTLLQKDSTHIKGNCVINFSLTAHAEPLNGMEMSGMVIDLEGKIYMVMVTSVSDKGALIKKFLQSFHIP